MTNSSSSKQSWWQFGVRVGVVLVVAFAAAHIASQAAFQEKPPQPLAESQKFWQQDTAETINSATTSRQKQPAQTNTTLPKAPVETTASSYLVADIKSGQILAAKNARQQHPIASITKLMTAVVAHETIGDNTEITITDSAVATYGSSGGLKATMSLKLSTLYYPLLLSSSNDAAAAIAEQKGHDRFRNLMNRKALSIGMNSTRFADASGLSATNVSTAADLGKLARYIYNHNQFIFDITANAQQTVAANQPGPQQYFNNNPVHTEPGFIGGKNGYTDSARHTALSVFAVQKQQQTRPVVIVTLGSDRSASDTLRLLSWTQNR